MPRKMSDALKAHYAGNVLTIANCVLITRADGVQIGLTSHESRINYNGITYKPTDSVQMSSMRSTADTGVDNLTAEGTSASSTSIIPSSDILLKDLMSGLYDGASVQYFQVNYADLSMESVMLLQGNFGEMTLEDGKWTAEIRSLTSLMKQNIGTQTTPTCRCKRLGDFRCKVPVLANFTDTNVSISPLGNKTFSFSTGRNRPNDWYTNGIARCTMPGNANDGIEREIYTSTTNGNLVTINLRRPFPNGIAIGDVFALEAGCQRRFNEDCLVKFYNIANFRGEPHLPGNSKLLQIGRSL